MKTTQRLLTALALALAVVTTYGAAHARLAPGSGLSAPGCSDGVMFDGVCATPKYVEDHLLGEPVDEVAACDDPEAACDLQVSQVEHLGTSTFAANYRITTWMFAATPCNGGTACFGGYTVNTRVTTELDLVARGGSVLGVMEIEQAARTRVPVLTRLGTIEYASLEGGEAYSVAAYDADGTILGSEAGSTGRPLLDLALSVQRTSGDQYTTSLYRVAPDAVSFGVDWCKDFVDEAVNLGGAAVGLSVGGGIIAALEPLVFELSLAAAGTFGPVAGLVTFGAGTTFVGGLGASVGLALHTGIRTAAKHMELNSVCDDLFDVEASDPDASTSNNDDDETPEGTVDTYVEAPEEILPDGTCPPGTIYGYGCWDCSDGKSESKTDHEELQSSGEITIWGPKQCCEWGCFDPTDLMF